MAVQQAIPKARRGIPGGFSGSAMRADFPVFERQTRTGERLVYLDAAASSPKPRVVIDTMSDAYAHHYANVHRGIYELSEDATARFEAARRKLAGFINAPTERECVFVRNATEAINLVAYSWGRTNVGTGDRVITTQLEHHANIVPWQQLCAEVGATLEYVAITDDGRLNADDLQGVSPGLWRKHRDDWHRRLGRDALGVARQVDVEHRVADHDDAAAGHLAEQRRQAISGEAQGLGHQPETRDAGCGMRDAGAAGGRTHPPSPIPHPEF